MNRAWWIAAGLALLFGIAACKENPAATAACKGKAGNSSTCNSCCHLNGASGSTWVGGQCGCVGGN